MRQVAYPLLACLILTPLSVRASEAAEPDLKKTTITDVRKADADFQFQGEYTGVVGVPGCGCQSWGLQIAARGGGKFEGFEYRGGLPGAGWDGATREKLAGTLDQGVLVLRGAVREFQTDGRVATARDLGGQELGQLHKIERASPTLFAPPPPGATVLFDGSSLEHLVGGRLTADGLLEVGPTTKDPVGDFRLHLEYRIPYMPYAAGQARGNSGVYVQQRYEVQILDSFGEEGVENDCGAIYRQQRPDLNMSFPPLAWQTYDIWFTAPRWNAAGQKLANARITVLHNGVPIHWYRELTAKTGAGKPEGPEKLPILFQDHGNPVHFRNLWIVADAGQPEAAPQPTRFPRLQRWLHRRR